MWEVDGSGTGEVHYGTTPFNMNTMVTSTSAVGSGTSQIHVAKLISLNNGTKYYYKSVMNGGQESQMYTFVTPHSATKERSTQLMAISDMQRDGSHPAKFQEIIEEGIIPVIHSEIGSSLNDLEGVLIPGDLVVRGGTYSQWENHFFNPSDSLSPYVPFYPVPGNHEYIGGGLPNFIKYFSLPDNAPEGLANQCWYKDISNLRIIGLNSNSGSADQNLQLDWLGQILNATCADEHIDFVFAQLHHPFKSELWTPGENDFTGKVIDSLESFTSACNKPSIHFFGHTHAYSRGQSRDHKHLWINVATAGGAIDNWGEFPNADYEEFVKSQDEYGFVLIDIEAGDDPNFTIRRYSRGDQDTIYDNVVRDELTIFRYEWIPNTPINIYPGNTDTIPSLCLTLKASEFSGVGDHHQASHWQIASGGNFNDSLIASSWLQNENFYFEENTQANDDLTDAQFSSIPVNSTYQWRVRYRDQNLEWSPWSTPTAFYLENSMDTLSANLVLNDGAENGATSWVGDIESLLNAECGSVSPYSDSHNFAVGGVCSNESPMGTAYQIIDLTPFSSQINSGTASVNYGGFLRNYNGSDKPEMYLEFYHDDSLLITSSIISSTVADWTDIVDLVPVPLFATTCRLVLKGTRNAGSDNDSYFDALRLRVMTGICPPCFGDLATDADLDGFCTDIDCNDADSTIYPGALEICDGLDNNCDGVYDMGSTVTWTGAAANNLWSDDNNWDQFMVPLDCQFVIINNTDSISVDGIFTCKGIDVSPFNSVTIQEDCYLSVDSQEDNAIIPVNIKGLLQVDGRWEVK